MKISKGANLSQLIELEELDIKVGETLVCRSKENHNDFQIYIQRLGGVYTPMGKFTDLATAIHFAQKLETPTMIEHGYQVSSLDHSQKMIVYYSTIEDEIDKYINSTNQISGKPLSIGESGISVRFTQPEESVIKRDNRLIKSSEMVYFGNYLLSDDRRRLYASHPEFGSDLLEERLSQVNHSDVENWNVWRRNNSDETKLVMDENENVVPDCRNLSPKESKDVVTAHSFKKMCVESLSPEGYEKFDEIMKELRLNRQGLK